MARMLPDREIEKLLGTSIVGGSKECVVSNSYELRLGNLIKFDSTGEEFTVPAGHFVEIQPGDFVTISSLEKLDFKRETLLSLSKQTNLAGLITPTTTMMREGFLFSSTKVDPGFRGVLNWGIRNSSIKTVRLKQGERLFKLTLFELEESEVPDKLYGERDRDSYQDSEGITPSGRMIPADIPEKIVVRRTERKIDPTKQLAEAGHPFSYIGTELIALHGKFEVVSHDVLLLKEDFKKMQTSLETKIETETTTLSAKLTAMPESLLQKMKGLVTEQFEAIFNKKMLTIYGTIATLLSFGFAIYQFVAKSTPTKYQAFVFAGMGFLALLFTLLVAQWKRGK